MSNLPKNKRPVVIAVANTKGGVGKTTTTLAIGAILAQKGNKILFIDLDPQGNLTLSLGYQPHEMPSPAKDLPTKGTLFSENSYRTQDENLDLVFSGSLILDDVYQIQISTGGDSYFHNQDLSVIRTMPYDYVLIDCPPSKGRVTINTLLVSDFLIIPSQMDFYSAYALKDMMELIGNARRAGNPGLSYRILITIFDRRNRIHHIIKNQLSDVLGSGTFETMIEVDTTLRQAGILGFPTGSSRGVRQYRVLVDELLENIHKTSPA
jgi:chromosome partitioning protein